MKLSKVHNTPKFTNISAENLLDLSDLELELVAGGASFEVLGSAPQISSPPGPYLPQIIPPTPTFPQIIPPGPTKS